MLARTLFLGAVGAIAGATIPVVAKWFTEAASLQDMYWTSAVGFVALAIGNIVNEYFGLYRINLLRRFFTRRHD
jgi:hypothetical protein